jgi:hypothetical protein
VPKLTLTLDEATLRGARRRALELGTSLNALVRDYLEAFAAGSAGREGLEAFLVLTEHWEASSGPESRVWTRDDVHER